MNKIIRLMFFALVIALAIVACELPAPHPPQLQSNDTPLPTDYDLMLEVEIKATQTAVARTEMANPANAPIAQTATAFVLTRQDLPMALTVILPDGSRYAYTYPELETYATLTLDLFDAPRQAVDVRSLLEEVKWTHFPIFSVTFEGRNSMTFHVDRLPQDAALYLDNGTVNFVSGEIPAEDWPYDVVLLIIR